MNATREQSLGTWTMGLSSAFASAAAVLLLWAYRPPSEHPDAEVEQVFSHLGASGLAAPISGRQSRENPGDLLVADLKAIGRYTRLELADIEKAGFAWADVTTSGRWRQGPGRHETHQSFTVYQKAQQKAYYGERRIISIRVVGPWPGELGQLPQVLTRYLLAFFRLPVRWEPDLPLPRRHRVSSDGAGVHLQYHTTPILNRLEKTLPDDAIVQIGLTARDIYPAEGWRFVFGMADLVKGVGVVSTARLSPRFWGFVRTPLARRLALLRTLKVLAHETGHTLGLNHCRAFTCLMSGCTGLAEHDTTPAHLCPLCMAKLGWRLRLHVGRRYRDLAQFFMKQGLDPEARWYHRQAVRMADARRRAEEAAH